MIQQDSHRPGIAQFPVAYRQHGEIPREVCEHLFERIDDAHCICNACALGPLDEARWLAECLADGRSQG